LEDVIMKLSYSSPRHTLGRYDSLRQSGSVRLSPVGKRRFRVRSHSTLKKDNNLPDLRPDPRIILGPQQGGPSPAKISSPDAKGRSAAASGGIGGSKSKGVSALLKGIISKKWGSAVSIKPPIVLSENGGDDDEEEGGGDEEFGQPPRPPEDSKVCFGGYLGGKKPEFN
jgi:hypothetical protein